MNCFVYVLASETRTYVGWTLDLERRLVQHNTGKGAKFTRGQTWQLVYAERLPSRQDAMRREWHLKRDRRFRRGLSQG
jgi:putative endonuclease